MFLRSKDVPSNMRFMQVEDATTAKIHSCKAVFYKAVRATVVNRAGLKPHLIARSSAFIFSVYVHYNARLTV